jgi:hypothetical protein
MDWKDIEIKDSDLDCNCPWSECSEHPGGLCAKRAAVVKHCPNPDCRKDHYLGDGSFAEDIHLCIPCSEALLHVFYDEIQSFMQKLTRYVPRWMEPLEDMCRTAYQNKFDARIGGGWVQPQRDAQAILALAFLVMEMDKNKRVPTELIQGLIDLKKRVRGIVQAFKMDAKHVGVAIEPE